MRHEAIAALYPHFYKIEGSDTDAVAYDSDGNLIELDEAAVGAKVNELIAERKLQMLRNTRNRMIAETDYWAMPDTPDMTAEQTAYRQALRDITNTYQSLDTVVWPTKPE